MPTIKSFDRPTVRKLSEEAEAALAEVAAKYGLQLARESGSFAAGHATLKFKFSATTEAGAPADFALHAQMLGLPADLYGKTFKAHGATYTVTEINLRRPRFPVSATGPEGGRYKFTVEAVRAGLR